MKLVCVGGPSDGVRVECSDSDDEKTVLVLDPGRPGAGRTVAEINADCSPIAVRGGYTVYIRVSFATGPINWATDRVRFLRPRGMSTGEAIALLVEKHGLAS